MTGVKQAGDIIAADPLAPADPLGRALAEALAEPPQRVRAVRAGGRAVWLKQAERLSLRWRIQKGDGARAFTADREGLRQLGAAGLPVAPILAEGPDWFATPHLGNTLRSLLRDPAQAGPARIAAFEQAGKALAGFHRAGFRHGRPSIKDVCWDGRRAVFIDLERYAERRNTTTGFALDAAIFAHSILATTTGERPPEFDAAIATYRAHAPEGVWQAATRRMRRLAWLRPLVGAARRLRPGSGDLAGVALTLEFFATESDFRKS